MVTHQIIEKKLQKRKKKDSCDTEIYIIVTVTNVTYCTVYCIFYTTSSQSIEY